MKKIALSVLSLIFITSCAGKNDVSQSSTYENTTESEYSRMLDFYRSGNISYETSVPEINDVSETLKDISFYRDGKKTSGKLYLPEGNGPFPTVVLSGGYYAPMHDYEDEAAQFAENGCAAIVFDFILTAEGEGSNGGLSLFSEVTDLSAVLDSLSYLPQTDTDNIFLWGHSFGGLVSTYVGCKRHEDIRGLILVEPSYDMYDIYDMMPMFDKDVMIFAGTQGDHIGKRGYEKALGCLPSADVVPIEGADHYFCDEYGRTAVDKAVKFIAEHII